MRIRLGINFVEDFGTRKFVRVEIEPRHDDSTTGFDVPHAPVTATGVVKGRSYLFDRIQILQLASRFVDLVAAFLLCKSCVSKVRKLLD